LLSTINLFFSFVKYILFYWEFVQEGLQRSCTEGVHQITPWPFLLLPWNPTAILLANWQVHDEQAYPTLSTFYCLPTISPLAPSPSHLLGSLVVFGGGSGVLVLGFGDTLGCSCVYNGLISNRYKKTYLLLFCTIRCWWAAILTLWYVWLSNGWISPKAEHDFGYVW
jgi:hypothetical protein